MNKLKYLYRKARWDFFWRNFQLPEVNLLDLVSTSNLTEPIILEKLCLPPYEGPQDHNDVIPLLSLVSSRKPNSVLELGTAHGATVANICAINTAKIYTVNALPNQIQGKHITITLEKEEIGFVYKKYGYCDRVIQIYENTWELDLNRYIQSKSIDFVIIDACHDADFVINDFFCVLPIIRDDAFVLFHDVDSSMEMHLRSGYIACMYLRKLGFDIQHIEGTWWAIWRASINKLNSVQIIHLLNSVDNLIVRVKKRDPIFEVRNLYWLSTIFE